MKTMLGLLALVSLLTACDRTTNTDVPPTSATNTAPAGTPQAVISSVGRVFPDAKDVTFSSLGTGDVWAVALKADAGYSATLNNLGNFYTIYRQIDAQSLPEPSRTAIQPGLIIQKAYQDLSEQKLIKGYVVVVADARGTTATYQFSAAGQLQNAGSGNNSALPRDSVFSAPLFSASVATGNLPEAIKAYQRTSQPDYTISQAFVLTVGGTKTYYVILRKGDTYNPVYFDEQGKRLPYGPALSRGLGADEQALTSNDIPPAARDVLNLYYPGWRFFTGTTNTSRTAYSLAIRQGYYSLLLFYDQSWTLVATYRQ